MCSNIFLYFYLLYCASVRKGRFCLFSEAGRRDAVCFLFENRLKNANKMKIQRCLKRKHKIKLNYRENHSGYRKILISLQRV